MKVEVRVHPSGERGLFATSDIKKGEFLTFLPIDYLQINSRWYTLNSNNKGPINFRYGITCDLVVPKEDNNTTVLGTFKNFLKNYGLNTKSSLTIELVGVSNHMVTDSIFLGHMINDFIDMSLIRGVDKYEAISRNNENVRIHTKLELFGDRLGLRVTAKKLIKKDKEIFWSYGYNYWKSYSNSEKFEITPLIETISLPA